MQKLQEINSIFETDYPLLETSVLSEFLVPSEEIENVYQITQETNWSNPSIVPNRFDQNWENWFKRIGTWGKIEVLHVDPENKVKGVITKDKFIKLMATPDMLKLYGKFRVEQVKIHRMEFIREYIGMDGKEYKEIFQINIDLLPQLKKGLGWWQKIF